MTLIQKRRVVAVIAIVVCVSLIACGWVSDLKLWQKIVNDLCCTLLGVAFLLVGFPERVDAVLSRFRKSEPVTEEVVDDDDTETEEEDDSEIETDTEDEADADYSDSIEGDDCDVTCDCETTEDKE